LIVRITGGMANQALMYMFGRSLSILRNEPVLYDWRRSTWDFALEPYGIEKTQALPSNLKHMYEEPGFAFDPKALEQPSDTYFQGYWQSWRYLVEPETLRQEWTLKEPLSGLVTGIANQLRNESSCFIHVRRGDYIANPITEAFHGTLGMDYYNQAIEHIKERVQNPQFYIFSDDPNYCEQNFSYPVLSKKTLDQHQDLFLMRNCRHGIGANSTFSWLANWLGDRSDRISIAPKKWFTNPDIDTSDLIPSHWTRL